MDLELPNQELVKCVVVGDTGVGKTRLVCARACGTKYTLGQLMQTHHSTVWAIDSYRRDAEVLKLSNCEVDGISVSLRLWDTFGYHDKDRRFAYSKADVVLLCFSTVRPQSLKNVAHVWYPEIKKFCPNTPIVLVGCQIDLRYLYQDPEFLAMDKGPFFQTIRECDVILPNAGRDVACDIGADYYETSVYTSYGLHDAFENVVRTALIERSKMKFWNPQLKRVMPLVIQAPPLPPKLKLPEIQTLASNYAADMEKLLNDNDSANVVFLVNGVKIFAHKIILIAASNVFYNLCLTDVSSVLSDDKDSPVASSDVELLIKTMDEDENSKVDSCNRSALHPAFISVYDLPTDELPQVQFSGFKSLRTAVVLNPDISPSVFKILLRYMYTGNAQASVPLWENVCKVARLLSLEDFPTDLVEDAPDEGYVCRRADKFRDLLLKQGLFSDALFHCEDGEVMTHKALIMARCDWMTALFTDNFKESSLRVIPLPGMSRQTFQCILEYLYTDDCPNVANVDVTELLEVANRFCLLRLISLLEQSIIDNLTKVEESGDEIIEEVLFLLEPAQYYNALQLAAWCMCYLCNNYRQVYKHNYAAYRALCEDNQEAVLESRWPPAWYLQEQDIYEKLVKERSKLKLVPIRKRQRNSSGCLCLSSRRSKKVDREECREA